MFREFKSNNKLWRVAWSYISLRWLGFFICAGIASMMYYCPGIVGMLLVFLSCLCIKYLGVFAREKCTLANGWRWSGLIYFLIVCAIKSFDDSLYYSLALHINVRWAICMIFFMALLAYMAVTDFRKHRMESERIALLAICAAMCLSEFTYLFELGIISVICANCALAVYSIVMISKGIRSVSLSSFNEGLLTAIVLVCCRFFDMDISMLVRGVGKRDEKFERGRL
ncbi:MAG: hypothetical protein MJ106_06035, partial [Lentisphaeria bacterium]|nr:hypothetical protein [Lentisphaeria bacterium]